MNVKVRLPSSKSIVNRYLILKEGFPNFALKWNSKAKDVIYLKNALGSYKTSTKIYIGEGGATLRFLALFLSSKKGSWVLTGAVTLFKRPQDELVNTINALGASAYLSENSLILSSNGWSKEAVKISALKTTQVLTGLVLAALASKNKLDIEIKEKGLNSGYFLLTKFFLESLGFKISFNENLIRVPADQKLKEDLNFQNLESDWSSAAFIYVMASIIGKAQIQGLMTKSFQPDARILEILKSAGVLVSSFTVEKPVKNFFIYTPISVNLQACPDLFPVLSVFSCFCSGESILFGAPQLAFKESNRINRIHELLLKCGYKSSCQEGGIRIQGRGFNLLEHKKFSFDVSSDHRIFMACEILKKFGYQIDIIGGESIEKSFPEYLEMKV